jgi:hypothetical protein
MYSVPFFCQAARVSRHDAGPCAVASCRELTTLPRKMDAETAASEPFHTPALIFIPGTVYLRLCYAAIFSAQPPHPLVGISSGSYS